jgi:hypothetical protein
MLQEFGGRKRLEEMDGPIIFPAFCCCHFIGIRLLGSSKSQGRIVEIYDSKNQKRLNEKLVEKLDKGLGQGTEKNIIYKSISYNHTIGYKLKFITVAHQQDSFNCGIFTLCNLTRLLLGKSPSRSDNDDMGMLRKFYVCFIENNFNYSLAQEVFPNLSFHQTEEKKMRTGRAKSNFGFMPINSLHSNPGAKRSETENVKELKNIARKTFNDVLL